jgi:hypothetical protein
MHRLDELGYDDDRTSRLYELARTFHVVRRRAVAHPDLIAF